jgi:hypothetical protein
VGEGLTIQTTLQAPSSWSPTFFSGTNDERVIRTRWYIPSDKQEGIYSFLAYRTEPFEPNYQLVDGIHSFFVSGDSIMAVFMDTLARETPGVYQYMIRTFDRYGRLGKPSEYGEGSNFAPASEPLIVYFKAQGLTDQPAIQLKWKLINPWRVRTLALHRAREFSGPFELLGLVSPLDSTYLDPVTDVMEAYYYYFEHDDIAQDSPVVSVVAMHACDYKWPAAVPDSVNAVAEGATIKVSWKSSGFQDRGYYVLRSKGYGEPKDIISPFVPIVRGEEYYSWTDTFALEGDQYYTYGVISESIGYVQSDVSESSSARPDVPVFISPPTDVRISRQSDTTCLISWSDMSADESHNHFGYHVYQKDSTAADGYKLLTTELLHFETNYYVLNHITPNDVFVVRAYNIFGNESADSESASLQDAFFYKFGPEYLMGQNEETGIRIKWNRPLRSDVTQYNLYRVVSDGKKSQIATLKAEETSYLDTKIKKGDTYYYFITADTKHGLSSQASELLTIAR